MGPDASPIANVFSSRVITRDLLSQGSSRLLEARRVVASAAFGGSGEARTHSASISQVRPTASRPSRLAARRPAPMPKAAPITLSVVPDHTAAGGQAWTFTYANGTFSIPGRRVIAEPRVAGPAPLHHLPGHDLRLAA